MTTADEKLLDCFNVTADQVVKMNREEFEALADRYITHAACHDNDPERLDKLTAMRDYILSVLWQEPPPKPKPVPRWPPPNYKKP